MSEELKIATRWLEKIERANKHLRYDMAVVKVENERLRMQLAACGVVANANTPETAKQARNMKQEYYCASVADVAWAVDREMELRAELEAAKAKLAEYADRGCENCLHAKGCDRTIMLEYHFHDKDALETIIDYCSEFEPKEKQT